jgi:hypothetical protein
VGVTELVRREAPPKAGLLGQAAELDAHPRARPRPPARRPCVTSVSFSRNRGGAGNRAPPPQAKTWAPSGRPSASRQCLEAGLLDESVIHIGPVLLGGGIRFYGGEGDSGSTWSEAS